MKRYLVRFPWHATVLVEVEAKSKKEAFAKAADEVDASVCVHCARHIEIDGDADSEPTIEVLE